MPRLITPQLSEFPFHVTARNHNREPFHLDLPFVWKILSEHLYLTRHFFGLKIYAFVLMPNHFHMICKTDQETIGTALNFFMRETSKTFNFHSGRCNQNWGSRYYRCEVSTFNYYMNCYKYVYQNPVRSKIVSSCENWPYSTLHGLLGKSHLIVPIEEDTILFSDQGQLNNENLNWLNRLPSEENLNTIRKALKRTKFKLPQLKIKKAHPLENELF